MVIRVLAVEADPDEATALAAAVGAAGHELTLSRTPEDALRALEADTFDIVLTDADAAGSGDSYGLCRLMKQVHPDLPVILLANLADPVDVIRGLEAGASGFIGKPYAPDRLGQRLGEFVTTQRLREGESKEDGVPLRFFDGRSIGASGREQVLDMLVTAVEGAAHQSRELQHREGEIALARQRLTGLYDIAVALNHCATEEQILNAALDGAVALPRVRAVWISLRDGERGFRLGGARNLPDVLSAPGSLDGDCRCRRLLLAGELDSVTNILECERIARAGGGDDGVRFHASVPLHAGSRTLGVMNLLSDTEDLFDEDDRRILYGIGSQIGFALERARMWHRLAALVEERTEKLTESEARFRTLVTEVNDGFFVTDADGVITFANPALAKMHGLADSSELEGHSFTEYLRPDVKTKLQASFGDTMASGQAPPLVVAPIVRPDGSETSVEIRVAPVLEGGRVTGTRGVVRDVTERERAEEELRLSDSILKCIGDVVLVADGEGRITYASPSVETVLGYTPEEALGDGWWSLAWNDPESARAERDAVAKRARSPELEEQPLVERPVRGRDGTTHWFIWRESKGPGELLVGVGHDITERKKLREQFLQAQKMEAVGRLAGGIAHDFNNILSSILITTELLLRDFPDPETARADVQTVHRSAKSAAGLTKQLLAFSRKQVLSPEVSNLNDLLRGMQDLLRSLLEEAIELEFLLAEDLDDVEVDPSQMEQVIMNLAVNARDALPQGGHILVETKNVDLTGAYVRSHGEARPGPHVLLSVSDDGVGMDAETVEHIFEPFFTTKGVGRGTGLGLATVHGIVNQSGGHIWVYSEPGKGTTFKIYLPRTEGTGRALEAEPASEPSRSGTGTILLVEDDDAVREATERVLLRAGYQVLPASSGAGAVALLADHHATVDLLITDVVMPGMTGPEVAVRLQRDLPELRVLFVSGYSDEIVLRQGVLSPGMHFLEKPFVVDVLLDRVREILDQPPPQLDHGDA